MNEGIRVPLWSFGKCTVLDVNITPLEEETERLNLMKLCYYLVSQHSSSKIIITGSNHLVCKQIKML